MKLITNFYEMFVDMAFYMTIGLLLTGVLNVFFNREWIAKQIGKRSLWSVIKASLLGVPLPICSCGVVPTAVYLHKNGASRGAVTSFLTSTPQTGVDSIIATYGLMGLVFAIFRPIAAFVSGVFVGGMTDLFVRDKAVKATKEEPKHSCCCGGHEEVHEDEHCCCGGHEEVHEEEHCCCGGEKHEHKHEEEHSCCCSTKEKATEHSCCSGESKPANGVMAKIKSIFTFAFGESLQKIAVDFVIGIAIAALITTFVPQDWLSSSSSTIVTMLIMLVIGIPMYICSTASIPVAVALMASGVSAGSAFVFLFVGPMTNIASLIILRRELGTKTMAIYLGGSALSAILLGLLLDFVVGLVGGNGMGNLVTPPHHCTPVYMVVVAGLFAVLLVYHIVVKIIKKCKGKPTGGCHCGDCGE